MEGQLLAIGFGLAAACSWGGGDFSGAVACRKAPVWTVILYVQASGGLVLLALALASAEVVPPAGRMAWGALAGICGGAGLVALYTGLARGRMGIVAPLSAVITALVPMVAGAFWQGMAGSLQVLGFALALAAVWLLASKPAGGRLQPLELGYSLLAGLGFGLFFLFIALAGRQTSLFWPLIAARCGSLALVAGMPVVLSRPGGVDFHLRGRTLACSVLAGICDACGNGFFVGAAKLGRLDVAAVLGSLYPAATVVLAWMLLKERLGSRQWVGVGMALAALGCIAWPGA